MVCVYMCRNSDAIKLLALISKIDTSCDIFISEAIVVPLPGNNKIGDSVTENRFRMVEKNKFPLLCLSNNLLQASTPKVKVSSSFDAIERFLGPVFFNTLNAMDSPYSSIKTSDILYFLEPKT